MREDCLSSNPLLLPSTDSPDWQLEGRAGASKAQWPQKIRCA
jgi:hypothetical protein